jgi:hypothetical protein
MYPVHLIVLILVAAGVVRSLDAAKDNGTLLIGSTYTHTHSMSSCRCAVTIIPIFQLYSLYHAPRVMSDRQY